MHSYRTRLPTPSWSPWSYPGRHLPLFALTVPGYWQLEDFAAWRLKEIGPDVVSRTHNPIHNHVEFIDWLSFCVPLESSEDEILALFQIAEVSVGRFVVEGLRKIFNCGPRIWTIKRVEHRHLFVIRLYIGMAFCASVIIHKVLEIGGNLDQPTGQPKRIGPFPRAFWDFKRVNVQMLFI